MFGEGTQLLSRFIIERGERGRRGRWRLLFLFGTSRAASTMADIGANVTTKEPAVCSLNSVMTPFRFIS